MSLQKFIGWFIAGIMIVVLGGVAGSALAAEGLPDRDRDMSLDKGNDDSPLGAHIELTAWPPGGVSVVQWQDVNGNWQDVVGWRGTLDSAGRIRWWVAAKDFGTGPFRWAVGNNVSIPFNLPAGAGQTVTVTLGEK